MSFRDILARHGHTNVKFPPIYLSLPDIKDILFLVVDFTVAPDETVPLYKQPPTGGKKSHRHHPVLPSVSDNTSIIISTTIVRPGYPVEQLVEALRYKPEGRGFDSPWCHWNYSLT
jgi:hypothetical protein